MPWMIRFIVACWCLASPLSVSAADQCRLCHGPSRTLSGVHRAFACVACHRANATVLEQPASRTNGSAGCVQCHRGYQRMYAHAMGSRSKERAFIARSFGRMDRSFEQKNCGGCHLQGCTDCHGSGHAIGRPAADACSRCHKGYFVGWDYFGRAPREEHERYQRGPQQQGESYLRMLPDVHYLRGMTCNDCHSMQSLIRGEPAAKGCSDCHRPSPKVLEHRIAAHLQKLTCTACHAAWAAQEYGTFYLQFESGQVGAPFTALRSTANGYAKSVYLRRQDLPPLGYDQHGRLAPIRPQFIAYYTRLAQSGTARIENRLLAAEWRAFTPHTIQRGSALCDACHDNPRRFLRERPQDRIYDLTKDGMTLASFWDSRGQTIINGSFLDEAAYRRLTSRTADYTRYYVEKWKSFAPPAAASSRR